MCSKEAPPTGEVLIRPATANHVQVLPQHITGALLQAGLIRHQAGHPVAVAAPIIDRVRLVEAVPIAVRVRLAEAAALTVAQAARAVVEAHTVARAAPVAAAAPTADQVAHQAAALTLVGEAVQEVPDLQAVPPDLQAVPPDLPVVVPPDLPVQDVNCHFLPGSLNGVLAF